VAALENSRLSLTDKNPTELAQEAREAFDDPERRAALVAEPGRFDNAVAAVLAAYGEPGSERIQRGQFEFAHEWLSDAEDYEAAGEACIEEIT
jgi:hypothetical protein